MSIDITQTIFMAVAVICAFLFAYTLTPPVRVLAFKLGAVDVPLDNRRMHSRPIPLIGGLAIYAGFVLTTMLFCPFSTELATIWIGGAAIVILGILDDIFRLPAWIKFIAQIAIACGAVWSGTTIDHINLGGEYISLGGFSFPLTVFWIVGLTNAMNFIDGLDGLSCGISAISCMSMFCVLMLSGEFVSAMIVAILAGACFGFLPFNTNPARIFMGDTGALFLGYALSVLSVQGVFKLHAVLAFIVPLVIFALPIGDTLFAILRRVCSGKSPFAADRGHLHHKLVDMGFTQKESVKILYAICAILGLIAVFFTEGMFAEGKTAKTIWIAVLAVGIFVINFLLMRSPACRKHSGLSDDEMTVEDYLAEKEDQKQAKAEKMKKSVKTDNGEQTP